MADSLSLDYDTQDKPAVDTPPPPPAPAPPVTAPSPPAMTWEQLSASPEYKALPAEQRQTVINGYAGHLRDYAASLPGANADEIGQQIDQWRQDRLNPPPAPPPAAPVGLPSYAGLKAGVVAQPGQEALITPAQKEAAQTPLVHIPRIGQQEGVGAQIGAGIVNAAASTAEGLTSPANLALLPLTPFKAAGRAASAAFGAQMLGGIPEQIKAAEAQTTIQGRLEGGLGVIGSLLFGVGALKHAAGEAPLAKSLLDNVPKASDQSLQIAAADPGFQKSAPDLHALVTAEAQKRGLPPLPAEQVATLNRAEAMDKSGMPQAAAVQRAQVAQETGAAPKEETQQISSSEDPNLRAQGVLPAVKLANGKIYTGPDHGDAFDNAHQSETGEAPGIYTKEIQTNGDDGGWYVPAERVQTLQAEGKLKAGPLPTEADGSLYINRVAGHELSKTGKISDANLPQPTERTLTPPATPVTEAGETPTPGTGVASQETQSRTGAALDLTPEQVAGQTWYRGHKQGEPFGQNETFIASSPEQSKQFASQTGGEVSEMTFKRQPTIYPNAIPWDEYQRSWRNSALLKGYDAVPIIEPNGQGTSLAVRNPDILEAKPKGGEPSENSQTGESSNNPQEVPNAEGQVTESGGGEPKPAASVEQSGISDKGRSVTKLTANDAQEVIHKLSILADEPELQEGYGLNQDQARQLLDSVPLKGGEWSIPKWATEAVRGELADHANVLRGIAEDAHSSAETGQSLRIHKQASKFEKVVESLDEQQRNPPTETVAKPTPPKPDVTNLPTEPEARQNALAELGQAHFDRLRAIAEHRGAPDPEAAANDAVLSISKFKGKVLDEDHLGALLTRAVNQRSATQFEAANTQKRGGGAEKVSLNEPIGERQGSVADTVAAPPEAAHAEFYDAADHLHSGDVNRAIEQFAAEHAEASGGNVFNIERAARRVLDEHLGQKGTFDERSTKPKAEVARLADDPDFQKSVQSDLLTRIRNTFTPEQKEFITGLAEQARSEVFGFGPGGAAAGEFPHLAEQAARQYATIGAAHILEGATDRPSWNAAMREEYGARDASDKELNKIWRDANQFVSDFNESQTGKALRPKAQIEQATGVKGPRATLADSVSKAQALGEYLSGMEKGSEIGAKSAKEHAAFADKWLAADQEQVRKTMTDFVNKTLPPDERGRFIGAIGRALTRPALRTTARTDLGMMYRNAFRVMRAIEGRAEDVYRNDVVGQIKTALSRSVDAPGIDVGYRRGLKALADQIDLRLTKPSKELVSRLQSLQDYVNRETAAGRDPGVPKEELDQLSTLTKLPLRDMPINALDQLKTQIENFVSLGRLKAKLIERAWERQRENTVKELAAVPSDPLEKRELYRAQPTEKLTTGQKFINAVRKTSNANLEFQQAIAPMDEIYDHLDGARGSYDGWASRNLKGNLDLAFNKTQAELRPIIEEGRALIAKNGLKKADLETVGIKGITRMIGRERLEAMGVRGDILDKIEGTALTPGQQAYYDFTRKQYDALGDRVDAVAHQLYQHDLERVPDYVPLLRDWAMHADREAPAPLTDPVAGEIPFDEQATMRQLQHDMNPKVLSRTEQGFLKARLEGAKTAIKVNAQDVFERHLNDALHFIHAQPQLKMLGEVVRKPEFAEKFGDAGQKIVLDHLDSVANQGYVNHMQRIRWIDWVRNSTSKGAVAFRLASNIVHTSQLPIAAYHAGGAQWWGKGLNLALSSEGQAFLGQHAAETYVRSGGEPAQADAEAISKFGRAGFFIARNIDKLNAQATFLGRYAKEMSKTGVPVEDVLSTPVNADVQALALQRMHRAVASPFVKDVPQMTSRGAGVGGNVSVARALNQFRNIFLDNWSNVRHDIMRVGVSDGERIATLLRNGELAAGAKEAGDTASHRAAITAALLASVVMETGIKMYTKQGLQAAAAPIFGSPPQKKESKEHQWQIKPSQADESQSFHAQFVHHLINRVPFVGQAAAALMYGETGIPVVDAVVNPLKEVGTALKAKVPETQAKHYVKAASSLGSLAGVPGSTQALELAQPAITKAVAKALPDKRKTKTNAFGTPKF